MLSGLDGVLSVVVSGSVRIVAYMCLDVYAIRQARFS